LVPDDRFDLCGQFVIIRLKAKLLFKACGFMLVCWEMDKKGGKLKRALNKNEGEELSPLQASGLGSKLRVAAGYPLGLSGVDPNGYRASGIPFGALFI
jgi:hypothetical protein